MQISYIYKQLAILRDYLEYSAKATKCKVLDQKFVKLNLNLADIYELLFSTI